MKCTMSLVCRTEQKQEQQQEISGGMTQSIFPQVEKRLLKSTDTQKALKFVGQKKIWDDTIQSWISYFVRFMVNGNHLVSVFTKTERHS